MELDCLDLPSFVQEVNMVVMLSGKGQILTADSLEAEILDLTILESSRHSSLERE